MATPIVLNVKPSGDLPEIHESLVTLTQKVDYDVGKRYLKLDEMKLSSSILALNASGAVSDCGRSWASAK